MDNINKFSSAPLPGGSVPRFVAIHGAFEPYDLDLGARYCPSCPHEGKVAHALPESVSHPKGAVRVRFDDGSAAGFSHDELLWMG